MQTLSSASRTCMASSSAVECTATDGMPSSLHARSTRNAISPRFAIRILSNISASCSGGARDTPTFLETGFDASCGSSDFNMITEISDAVGESGRGLGRITASEVFGAEVLVASTITQHVIDGCQDRRGNRNRCLLGAVARFETEELGLEIAVLLARCAPRSLHQYRLEPGCSLPNPR